MPQPLPCIGGVQRTLQRRHSVITRPCLGVQVSGYGCQHAATRLGAAFAYSNSRINGNTNMSAKVDAYQAIFYGSYSLDPRTEVNFQAAVGMNDNSTSRHIRFAAQSRKDFTNQTASLRLRMPF
ncbi:MAG: autotransporter outer membrane beta-barrel domain-containing protein [Pusillimonas sp.]